MIDTTSTLAKIRKLRESRWSRGWGTLPIVLGLPFVLLLLSVCRFVRNEYIASLQLQKEVAAIRNSMLPFDNLSLSRYFFNTASHEQSTAWRDVLVALEPVDQWARDASKTYKPNTSYDIELLPAPGADGQVDWPDAASFEEYSNEVQPIISRIEELTRDPKPTWQPLDFQGFSTRLPDAHQSQTISRMLAVEFCHAVYIKNSDRALRALRLDAASMVVYDWQVFSMADSITCLRKVSLFQQIRESLAHDIWAQEQLDSISEIVGPEPDLAGRWYRTLATDRAMLLTSMDANSGALLSTYSWNRKKGTILASSQLELLKLATRNMDAGNGGYQGLADRVRASNLQFNIRSSKFLSFLWGEKEQQEWRGVFGFRDYYAMQCERCESSRRLTRTALAIKQYQLENQRWPATLSELSEAKLFKSDRTALAVGLFEYRIAPDGKSSFIGTSESPENQRFPESEIR